MREEAAIDGQLFEGKDGISLRNLLAYSSLPSTGISDHLSCSKDCCMTLLFPHNEIKKAISSISWIPMKAPPHGCCGPWE